MLGNNGYYNFGFDIFYSSDHHRKLSKYYVHSFKDPSRIPFPNGWGVEYLEHNIVNKHVRSYRSEEQYEYYIDDRAIKSNISPPSIPFIFQKHNLVIEKSRIPILHSKVDDLISSNEYFLYPIDIFLPQDVEAYYKLTYLNPKVIDYIKNTGRAKIYFNYEWEGRRISDLINGLCEFSKFYNLKKEDIIFSYGNLKPIDNDYFTEIGYNYFFDFPWFITKCEPFPQRDFDSIILQSIYSKKRSKILCLNRRPHMHRLTIVYHILNDPLLKDNTSLSLGLFEKTEITPMSGQSKEDATNIVNYFSNSKELKVFEDENLSEVQSNINDKSLHKCSFVNLITETDVCNRELFITEKTYKSIYNCQPFIVFGSPGVLNELKNKGFTTFSDFWSEEYDNIENDYERMLEVLRLSRMIANKSEEELKKMHLDMIPIFRKNFDVFRENFHYRNHLERLFNFKDNNQWNT